MTKYMWPLCLLLFIFSGRTGYGQRISRDSATQILKLTPAFTIYRDNYIVTGTTPTEIPTSDNSDIKYQISFKHRLTDASLPRSSYLFLTYTQKAFWDIYSWSSPFEEINFNPGLGLGKLLFRNGELLGSLALQIEHESNGRDSIFSRSWNYVSGSYTMIVTPTTILQLKAWLPFLYKRDNPDLIDYVGYSQVTYIWEIKKERLIFDVQGRKGARDWKGNIQAQLSYRPTNSGKAFITLQWYHGYAENLVDYERKTNMLRLGFSVKPFNYLFY